jgi:tetratricopeptide (TPR) repeat protein
MKLRAPLLPTQRTTTLLSFGWLCWLTIQFLVGPGLVHAADQLEGSREYDFDLSKGIVLYNSERYSEAERYLSEAFKAKPGDPVAGHYLGQSLLRLKRYTAAEERYREILRRHPDDARARMGLGMALYHQERYTDASANLTMAEQALKDEPLLHYYLGLAAARRQSFDQASEKFLRAGELDPELAREPRYQRGATLYSEGQSEQAAAELQAAALTAPATVAQSMRPAFSATQDSPSKRWNAGFALSAQYDSNVVLLPGGVSPPGGDSGISHKDDFVTVLTGRGEYRFIQDDRWTVGAGYGFYQNIHARLSNFDVQNHTPTLYVQRQFAGMQLRLQYILDYVTVGGNPYLLSNALQPTLTVPQSERSFTQAFVRYQYKDFKSFRDNELGTPVNQTRDGVNWMFGGMQYLLFAEKRGHVRAGYIFDADRTGGPDLNQAVPGRPTNADWAYIGHRFSTGASYQFSPIMKADLAFDYYRQSYSNPNSFSPGGATVRSDNIYQLTGTAVRDLNSWLWVAFQYSFTRDQSNVAVFDYSRHIVSFTLGGTF